MFMFFSIERKKDSFAIIPLGAGRVSYPDPFDVSLLLRLRCVYNACKRER